MLQLQHRESEFRDLDVRIKVVTFDNDILGKAYASQNGLDWPLLLDQDRQLYQAYGTGRGSWWSIYGAQSLLRYLRVIFGGTLPGKPGRDWRQLGGDVLISPDGIVRLHHISQTPHDRPSVDSILRVVEGESTART